MTESERSINTAHAFCSLIVPGFGQLLQKRPGAAFGFFVLFALTAFLPILIVSLLFMDRFSYQPLRVHIIHILLFGGVCIPLMLAYFFSVVDAAAWKPGDRTRFLKPLFIWGIFFFFVLVFLLLPAIPSAREAARRMQCSNNMKQIAIAFQNYHGDHGHLPPAYTVDEDGKPLHSWRVLILPYIEQKELFGQIRLDEPWDSEHNRQFHAKVPSVFQCPSARLPDIVHVPAPTGSFYSVVYGAETAFTGSHPTKFEDMAGGTSNTIVLVERRTPVNWMDPSREITFETAIKGINVDAMGISSYHPGVVLAAFGDGAVRSISESVDKELMRALLTLDKRNDGTLL